MKNWLIFLGCGVAGWKIVQIVICIMKIAPVAVNFMHGLSGSSSQQKSRRRKEREMVSYRSIGSDAIDPCAGKFDTGRAEG